MQVVYSASVTIGRVRTKTQLVRGWAGNGVRLDAGSGASQEAELKQHGQGAEMLENMRPKTSHNHGSVENGCISKIGFLSFRVSFSTEHDYGRNPRINQLVTWSMTGVAGVLEQANMFFLLHSY